VEKGLQSGATRVQSVGASVAGAGGLGDAERCVGGEGESLSGGGVGVVFVGAGGDDQVVGVVSAEEEQADQGLVVGEGARDGGAGAADLVAQGYRAHVVDHLLPHFRGHLPGHHQEVQPVHQIGDGGGGIGFGGEVELDVAQAALEAVVDSVADEVGATDRRG